MKILLRSLTLLCYVLPFTFFLTRCTTPLVLDVSYNKTEGEKMIADNPSIGWSEVADTLLAAPDTLTTPRPVVKSSDSNAANLDTSSAADTSEQKSFMEKVAQRLFFPTDQSASAIGYCLIPKNQISSISIALSIIISLTSFIIAIFIKARKPELFLLCANMTCVIVFIVDYLYVHVTLKYGVYILSTLLLIQLYLPYNSKRLR